MLIADSAAAPPTLHPPPRFAVALHGRVGTLRSKASTSVTLGLNASLRILHFCAASFRQHLVTAQPDGTVVDVFIHSWNPERGAYIDAHYGPPVASRHDAPDGRLPKAQSQARSIARVAQLIRAHEQSSGQRYTLVLVLRLDAVLGAPVLLGIMGNKYLWFAQCCCLDEAKTEAERAVVRSECGGALLNESVDVSWGRRVVRRCRVDHFGHSRCGKRWCGPSEKRAPDVNRDYFLMDWWFAARSDVVSSWSTIANNWSTYYLPRARELHIAYEPQKLWSHFAWAMHVRDVLKFSAHVRYLPPSAFRVVLAQHGWSQSHVPQGCPLDIVRFGEHPGAASPPAAAATFPLASMVEPCPLHAIEVEDPAMAQDRGDRPRTTVCCGRHNKRACGVSAAEHEAMCEDGRRRLHPLAMAACAEPGDSGDVADIVSGAPCNVAYHARRRAQAREAAKAAAYRRRVAARIRRAARSSNRNRTRLSRP